MENDTIDPRIKVELECLNSTSENINQLENEISERRNLYRTALVDSTQQLNHLARKLGDCVTKARPYYEARRTAKQALQETQEAALHYERAVSMHTAAREMVSVAEQGMLKDCRDTAWPEMLNHATLKVNEAEIERFGSEVEHQQKAQSYKCAEQQVKKLEKKLKSSIQKSRNYFETKQKTQKLLEELSEAVGLVEVKLQEAKSSYSQALHNLEAISDSIHASRDAIALSHHQHRMMLGEREEGVGAEANTTTENVPEIKIDNGYDDTSSIQTVLSDLRKIDSIEHLNGMFESSSLDNISCHSSASFSSSRSSTFTRESLPVSPIALTPSPMKKLQVETDEQSSEDEAPGLDDNDASSLASDATNNQKNLSQEKNRTRDRSKLIGKVPAESNNNKFPGRANGSMYNGEILLTIAGLADVSTP